ncbi:MAG TPA: HAD-IIIA family hydrolase [Anaerolineales bacterium]|nr:HAD-IIIA family hydrolase [Anaerolineales bacterium]
MGRHPKGCLLFDWGDTLMRDFKEFSSPMKDWPKVEAVPGAAEMLSALHPDWTLALATNADVSDEADIRAALQRAGLDRWLEKIYCFRKIGHKKPSPEFFRYILEDLGLSPDRVVMVGDNYEADVLGANACGLKAVWFNPHTDEERKNERQRTVRRLAALPDLLPEFMKSA